MTFATFHTLAVVDAVDVALQIPILCKTSWAETAVKDLQISHSCLLFVGKEMPFKIKMVIEELSTIFTQIGLETIHIRHLHNVSFNSIQRVTLTISTESFFSPFIYTTLHCSLFFC